MVEIIASFNNTLYNMVFGVWKWSWLISLKQIKRKKKSRIKYDAVLLSKYTGIYRSFWSWVCGFQETELKINYNNYKGSG